jgi:hypothetical protein
MGHDDVSQKEVEVRRRGLGQFKRCGCAIRFLLAVAILNTAANGLPNASFFDHPVKASANGFMTRTQFRRSVVITPSPTLRSVKMLGCL